MKTKSPISRFLFSAILGLLLAGCPTEPTTTYPTPTDQATTDQATTDPTSPTEGDDSPAPPPFTMKLNKSELSLVCGETYNLTGAIEPASAAQEALTWDSGDEEVITVKNGILTTHKTGTALIRVKAKEVIASCSVTVTPAALILFATDEAFSGDLGGRTGADKKVTEDANFPPFLEKASAFLSVSLEDQILNMPETRGFSPDLPVYAADNCTKIADSWTELLETPHLSLTDFGVYPDYDTSHKNVVWWSGSESDGSLYYNTETSGAHTCEGWTSRDSFDKGRVGIMKDTPDSNVDDWISTDDSPANYNHRLLGLGISPIPVKTETIPAQTLELDSTMVSVPAESALSLSASVLPTDTCPMPVGLKWTIEKGTNLLSLTATEGFSAKFNVGKFSGEAVVSASLPDGTLKTECRVYVTPNKILLFGTESSLSRPTNQLIGIQSTLKTDKNRPANYRNIQPFISSDEYWGGQKHFLANLPRIYNFSPDLPVYGKEKGGNGLTLLANNWNELLSEDLIVTLDAAKVISSVWWSGSSSDGKSSANDAEDWSQFNAPVTQGAHNLTDKRWLSNGGYSGAGGWAHLLGIAW